MDDIFDGPATIPATQYMRPDGRAVEGSIPISDIETLDRADALIRQGYRFTLEVLTTGQISLAVEGPIPGEDGEEGDIGVAVFSNAPGAIAKNIGRAMRQAEAAIARATPTGG
jgi:hypothetical protein